jgi:hypothetical protein
VTKSTTARVVEQQEKLRDEKEHYSTNNKELPKNASVKVEEALDQW